MNQQESEARDIKYLDIPKSYVWKSKERIWQKRKKAVSRTISRLHLIQPSDVERFAMRLLLLNVTGATSFENLRTVEGEEHTTFHEAAVALKLLQDDKEWDACLTEAALTILDTEELRILFSNILRYSEPTGIGKLWHDHKDSLCQDIFYRERQKQPCNNIIKERIYNEGLAKIDNILRKNGKELSQFPGMPKVTADFHQEDMNQLIKNHTSYDKTTLKKIADINMKMLNVDQLRIYDNVLKKIDNKDSIDKLMFVDGPGVV